MLFDTALGRSALTAERDASGPGVASSDLERLRGARCCWSRTTRSTRRWLIGLLEDAGIVELAENGEEALGMVPAATTTWC